MAGKTYIDDNGYYRFIDTNKLVHRWIMEKNIGRKLKPMEIVHHRDGNKLNNSINNLELFDSQDQHETLHIKRKVAKFFCRNYYINYIVSLINTYK
jgi:hypothetical protein